MEYYAAQYRIPANMVRAVIRVESNWNPGAVSSKGAQGMMQLMPGTARSLEVNHPFWIYQNIGGGTAYLAYLYRRLAELAAGAGGLQCGSGGYRKTRTAVFITGSICVCFPRSGRIPPLLQMKGQIVEIHCFACRKPRFSGAAFRPGPGSAAKTLRKRCLLSSRM